MAARRFQADGEREEGADGPNRAAAKADRARAARALERGCDGGARVAFDRVVQPAAAAGRRAAGCVRLRRAAQTRRRPGRAARRRARSALARYLGRMDLALLEAELSARGEPAFRARQVWSWLARGAKGYE